jgi:hypothetical protein
MRSLPRRRAAHGGTPVVGGGHRPAPQGCGPSACLQGIRPWSGGSCRPSLTALVAAPADSRVAGTGGGMPAGHWALERHAGPRRPCRGPPPRERARAGGAAGRACRTPEPAAASSAGGSAATRACSASMAVSRSFQAALRRPAATSSPASAASASSASARDSAPLCSAAFVRVSARRAYPAGGSGQSLLLPAPLPCRAQSSAARTPVRCGALPRCAGSAAARRRPAARSGGQAPGPSQGAGACVSDGSACG